MSKGYENFNNSETSFRKSTLIQERIGLVSTHMYKQFLDYQHATLNTAEIFVEMIDNLNREMRQVAKELDFERAMELRDILFELQSE